MGLFAAVLSQANHKIAGMSFDAAGEIRGAEDRD